MNSKEKGDLALAKAISYFIESGCEVLLPIGDKRPYDMVIENKDGILEKVQSKYTSHKNRHGNFVAPLRVMGGNRSSGNNAKKYNKKDFDILFVYTSENSMYIIPFNMIKATGSLTLGKENEKYRII